MILYLRGRWHVLFKGDDVTYHLSSPHTPSSVREGYRVMRIALSFGAKIYRGSCSAPLREILKIQKFFLVRACGIKFRVALRAHAALSEPHCSTLARNWIMTRLVWRKLISLWFISTCVKPLNRSSKSQTVYKFFKKLLRSVGLSLYAPTTISLFAKRIVHGLEIQAQDNDSISLIASSLIS